MSAPISLPAAEREYDQLREQMLRNTLENELQSIRDEINRVTMNRSPTFSLSVLRHHFLLMGSSGD